MQQYDLTRQNVSSYRYGENGCVNIGFMKNLDAKLLIPLLSRFHAQYPEIEVNLYGYSNQSLHQRIQNGSLDIGFGFFMNNSLFHYRFLKSYPLVVLTAKEGPLAGKKEISEQNLKNVIYDVRNYPQNRSVDLEGLLIKIACGYGNAVVHQFAEGNRFQEYLTSIPLTPFQEKDVCLIYDDHYSRTRDLFLDICI